MPRRYLGTVLEQVSTFGDVLQLVVVEMIRKGVRTHPAERSRYIRAIYTLLQSPSPAVQVRWCWWNILHCMYTAVTTLFLL